MDSEESPPRKKICIKHIDKCDSFSPSKRLASNTDLSKYVANKKRKTEKPSSDEVTSMQSVERDVSSMKCRNFLVACQIVASSNYRDFSSRFMIAALPKCLSRDTCENYHHEKKKDRSSIPEHALAAFKIDFDSHEWRDCLDVARHVILTSNEPCPELLQHVSEIILNAHQDRYNLHLLLSNCTQVIHLAYSTHPPCTDHYRKAYNKFLTNPMNDMKNSGSDRSDYDCHLGLFNYSLSRLEKEITEDSSDEPLIDKFANVPESDKESFNVLNKVRNNEIYEALNRVQRIGRLMTLLDCLVKILQFDLAIWLARHSRNQTSHLMRSNRPLMAQLLWPNNVLYTGAIQPVCRRILRIFVTVVQRNYPLEYVETVSKLLNTMVQTIYICEANSDSDYPNVGRHCNNCAVEIMKFIKDLPIPAVVRVISNIQPMFFQHITGSMYLSSLLDIKETDVQRILIHVLQNKVWKQFHEGIDGDKVCRGNAPMKKTRTIEKFYKFFTEKVLGPNKKWLKVYQERHKEMSMNHQDADSDMDHLEPTREQFVYILYLTYKCYLEAYSIVDLFELVEKLNSDLASGNNVSEEGLDDLLLPISGDFVKKYRTMYQLLQKSSLLFDGMKDRNDLALFKDFRKICFFDF